MTTEEYLIFKSPEEKKDIINFLNNKQLQIKDLTIESLINIISCAKSNLNEELKKLVAYKPDFINNQVYSSIIDAKNNKISKLVDLYNNSNSYNKLLFKDNTINFSNITTIDSVKLEIDNFSYDIPLNFQLVMYAYDGEIIYRNIIPFNFSGIYSEYIDLKNSESSSSLFTVSNKNNIYFYSCVYTKDKFELGRELNLKYNKDYSFDKEGHLIFDKEQTEYDEVVIMYQPNENAFEITNLLKRLYKIELIVDNDKIDINRNFTKRLVLFND